MKYLLSKNRLLIFFLLITVLLRFPSQTEAGNETVALEVAKTFLESMPFSRSGLIEQLKFAGFTQEEAEYAADNSGADWYEMAVKSALSYLETSDYSENGLIRQLESSSEGYTHEEAVHGVSEAGKDVDWNEMAARRAAFYLRSSPFSEKGLLRQLESERVGFTHEQALYGVESVSGNVDWNDMALKRAQSLLETSMSSESALLRQLESDSIGFTHEQAVYAVSEISKTTDWFEVAAEKAKSYLQVQSLSRTELIDYLESDAEGFTHEQAVYAADNSGASWGDMITVLAENIDNLFPIHGIEMDFMTPEQHLYTDIGPETAIQTSTQYGQRNLILFSNPDSVNDRSYVVRVNSGNLENFMLSMDIVINDVFPSAQAGCFIGYANDYNAALQTQAKTQVLLMADGEGIGFYKKTENEAAGTFTRILESAGTEFNLTIMRFIGQTYAFINGEFAGQFNDSNTGPFNMVYGVTTLKNGDTASCSFDNLSVRKVNNL